MIKDNLWTWRCPKCGSTERVAQSIVDDDKAAGRLSEKVEWGAVEMDETR